MIYNGACSNVLSGFYNDEWLAGCFDFTICKEAKSNESWVGLVAKLCVIFASTNNANDVVAQLFYSTQQYCRSFFFLVCMSSYKYGRTHTSVSFSVLYAFTVSDACVIWAFTCYKAHTKLRVRYKRINNAA